MEIINTTALTAWAKSMRTGSTASKGHSRDSEWGAPRPPTQPLPVMHGDRDAHQSVAGQAGLWGEAQTKQIT